MNKKIILYLTFIVVIILLISCNSVNKTGKVFATCPQGTELIDSFEGDFTSDDLGGNLEECQTMIGKKLVSLLTNDEFQEYDCEQCFKNKAFGIDIHNEIDIPHFSCRGKVAAFIACSQESFSGC